MFERSRPRAAPAWSLRYREGVLAETADGAYPIIRDILKRGAGRDAAFGIAYLGVVHIAAGALILIHHTPLLSPAVCPAAV